jgi:murein DD-endopeptidase MepM/ murein hydrolase activator NlpD
VTTIAGNAIDRAGSTTPAPVAPKAPAGGEPVRHKVQRGETAYTIARAYNVSAKALADWNGLGSDLAVREGQFLIIPTAASAPIAPQDVATVPGQGSPTPTPPSAKKPLPDEKTAPAAEKAKETPASPDMSSQRTGATATKLVMPVAGKIIRTYQKKKNDGIDISAAAGTAVKAADAGTVAAVTKDTTGTPIVVIRHAGDLLTVYAGVDQLKVAKGDKVARGQAIAVVRSGNPAFLHFEVRRGVDSVDPMPYLQ